MKTESFKLSKNILTLLEKNGITIATPIQKKIIPAVLAGRDVLAQSETGSGKTISFAIPIIEQTNSSDNLAALVLVPTRELCMQVTDEFIKFSQGKRLGITAVYGGVSIENQIRKLKKTNIIVATPGRLIDLIDRKAMNLNKIKFLVFDEADRMLDMGFIHDIEKILKNLPHKLQTMLFSATVSKEITEISKKYLFDPVYVILESFLDPEFLQQTYYQTTREQKLSLLIHLLKNERDLSLVFCNRKHITAKLADKLTKNGIYAKCLHGDMSQNLRERVTEEFRHKKFSVLIATDVASRGLHIEDISHVYNYEIPKDVDSYTHRVGRTARAGKKGEAISLVTNGEEQKFFKQILFNYRGSITLKKVDSSLLPKIESIQRDKRKEKNDFDSSDRKRNKENSRNRDEKPYRKNKRTRNRRKDKPSHFVPDDKESYNNDKRTFGNEKPKFWDKEKSRSFRQGKRKSSGDENKYFDYNKQKKWNKNRDSFSGSRKTDTWDNPISMIWGEENPESRDKKQSTHFSDDKSRFNKKNKKSFFGKKKSKFREDRKSKFRRKGKSNKKSNKK